MLNDFTFTNEQLFSELTPEEGSVIAGGLTPTISVNSQGNGSFVVTGSKFVSNAPRAISF